MKKILSSSLLTISAIVGSQLASQDVAAQTAQHTSQSTDPSTPRLHDGRPDLNGTWVAEGSAARQASRATRLPDGSICAFGNCAPIPALTLKQPLGTAPAGNAGNRGARFPNYKPEFLAKVKELNEKQVQLDTALRCMPPGVPRIGPPAKIAQTDHDVVFLYNDQNGAFFRIIPTDGATPPKPTQFPTYLGDSVGKWEGDTFVVETANFNDETWLTDNGAFHTKELRVVERLTRTGNKLEYRATAYDPAVLAEPWEGTVRMLELTDQKLDEPLRCEDRSIDQVVDGGHHDNPR